MATSTKENVLIFLALLITYFGVYLLTQSGTAGVHAKDARWAGFFSVTLGIFSLLTLLFGHADSGAVPAGTPGGRWGNVYLIAAGVALAVSAFFNLKLFKALPNGTFRHVVMANIAAHVILLVSYFLNFGAAEQRFNAIRTGLNGTTTATPVFTPVSTTVPVTPGLGLISPRLPIRAR